MTDYEIHTRIEEIVDQLCLTADWTSTINIQPLLTKLQFLMNDIALDFPVPEDDSDFPF